ncbi:GNAT family N-acetyltransferase [Paeniglutamicibacter sp. MACA_103]|uniref:GNAT family N-acetyltransferase n=1 Tax=Paeniglutamicibacter sp. MACA_103 TaxID=3377337 RepID=UPI00389486DD
MTMNVGETSMVRALRIDEQDLLARATLGNANWPGPRFTLDQVLQMPVFARYFASWPGPGDFGLVAEDSAGVPVGVVWLRYFAAASPGYGFVAESIPELCVWVAEGQRGHGLGTRMITGILEQARFRALPAISLSVETGNPARVLYERFGFAPAGPYFDAGTLVIYL